MGVLYLLHENNSRYLKTLKLTKLILAVCYWERMICDLSAFLQ